MSFSLEPRPDLGVRGLLPLWKGMFSRRDLRDDTVAALTVACIAVPLSLAIALASGVPPAVGLVTAIVAGIVCALFGGNSLQVSGPAAAMAVLTATIVQEQGMAALLVIGVGCGLLQLATGTLGLGRIVRLVPLPVIEGFTAGIGAIILIGQLPRALGLPPPSQSHVFDVVTHIGQLVHQTRPAAVAITALTLGVIYGLPRITRRIPASLAAVAIATAGVAALRLDVATIGEIPRSLPAPHLPSFPSGVSIGSLLGSTLVVFAVASLETLLSASAVDKLSKSSRTDPDQELIGQGLGNVASALFGGIPVTGVIARSGTNVQAGAKTRRAAILHALVLLATVFAIGPLISQIPVAALAAVLFSVAFRMLSPVALFRLFRHSRADGVIYAITFLTIVFVDLLKGVQWGVVAALAIAAIRLGRTRLLSRGARVGDHYAFALEGPLTFLSSLDVETIRREVDALRPGESDRAVVFDVRHVTTVDASGVELLGGLVDHARARGMRPFVLGLTGVHRDELAREVGEAVAADLLVDGEGALAEKLGTPGHGVVDARLRTGVERYRATIRPRYTDLFAELASGQQPHTLFITCCDSRINPNLITATEPGELFLVRNIGNLVPPSYEPRASAVGAAIEYAVAVLHVRKIIVCGHSCCGALRAVLSDTPLPERLTHLAAWLDVTRIRDLAAHLPSAVGVDQAARLSVLAQLDHLATYPLVAEGVEAGDLSVGGWFFDVGSGDIEAWSPSAQRFVPVGHAHDRAEDESQRELARAGADAERPSH